MAKRAGLRGGAQPGIQQMAAAGSSRHAAGAQSGNCVRADAGGPLDYHQGGMRNVLPENYQFRDIAPPVQGTRGHQLAMYVVYQNHLPMVADSPSAYRGQPALDFLFSIPATWDETRVLHAEMGKCLVIARRQGDAWYLGGMTAREARELDLPLGFLGKGSYASELYLDKPADGPTALTMSSQKVDRAGKLQVSIPPSGGFAARLLPGGR